VKQNTEASDEVKLLCLNHTNKLGIFKFEMSHNLYLRKKEVFFYLDCQVLYDKIGNSQNSLKVRP
jgi:hypothetical protein